MGWDWDEWKEGRMDEGVCSLHDLQSTEHWSIPASPTSEPSSRHPCPKPLAKGARVSLSLTGTIF